MTSQPSFNGDSDIIGGSGMALPRAAGSPVTTTHRNHNHQNCRASEEDLRDVELEFMLLRPATNFWVMMSGRPV